MLTLQRILVASDLSPRAEGALTRAMQLAVEHRATLTVLHVMEETAQDETETQQMTEKLTAALRQQIERSTPHPSEAVAIQVVTGKPFVEIIRRAREEAADLIVVGAHGEHFLKDFFLGTTAEKIARKGDRPVLVVKQTPQGPYKRVLVAVDFSESSRHALEFALQLAPKAEFHVLHAYEGFEGRLIVGGASESEITRYRQHLAKAARQEMRAFLHDSGCADKSVHHLLRHGRAPYVITKTAKRLHADLVAVGTTGRTGLPYILLGSVAEHVLREVNCDVVVVRRPESVHFELP
jgi:universal stress protein E